MSEPAEHDDVRRLNEVEPPDKIVFRKDAEPDPEPDPEPEDTKTED